MFCDASVKTYAATECVLHWIKTTKQLPVFIQNRTDVIQKEKDLTFSYVPSNQNPADFATRGLSVTEISNCTL